MRAVQEALGHCSMKERMMYLEESTDDRLLVGLKEVEEGNEKMEQVVVVVVVVVGGMAIATGPYLEDAFLEA